jgi:hypothetical protein
MRLLGSCDYLVTIVLHVDHKKDKYGIETYPKIHCMTCRLLYCGGSQIDENGHHIAGGVWCKEYAPSKYKYFYALNVVGIAPCDDDRAMHDHINEMSNEAYNR